MRQGREHQGVLSARILLVRERLVEVVGGCVFRTQVKHRKANSADKLVISGEVQNPFVAEGVLVAGCNIRSIILTQGSAFGPCPRAPMTVIVTGSQRDARTDDQCPACRARERKDRGTVPEARRKRNAPRPRPEENEIRAGRPWAVRRFRNLRRRSLRT